MHQVQLSTAMDVELVERELGVLWKDSAAEVNDEGAIMRARVANLMVLTPTRSGIDEIHETLEDLSTVHPSRALVIVAERTAADNDIELFIHSFYQSDAPTRKRLCCEEIMLVACGKFVRELPSVSLPLLVPDLPTFLWWREALHIDDKVFKDLCTAANRLVIDSAEAEDCHATVLALARLFEEAEPDELGISDINWARLTSWRALLASFYDVPHSRSALSKITNVVIDYSAPEEGQHAVAPQALLFAGWLASRLEWKLSAESTIEEFVMIHESRAIRLRLNRVDRPAIKSGRLARVELTTENDASFVVLRQENGGHLETQGVIDGISQPGRVLPVRNRTTAQLLARELEILCNDKIYSEAVAIAAQMITLISHR